MDGAFLALQHALYEKTGLHCPTNVVPFPTQTVAVTAGQLESLAGVYAGNIGYDRVCADTNAPDVVLSNRRAARRRYH